jgi:hypothetical protein
VDTYSLYCLLFRIFWSWQGLVSKIPIWRQMMHYVLQDTFSDLLQYYNILNLWLYISNVYYIALDPNLLNYYVSTVYNIHFTNHRNPNKRFTAQLLIIYLYIMKAPQAVINFILESFPYLVTPKICSYHNYSISYGTLNMVWSSQIYQCHDNSS